MEQLFVVGLVAGHLFDFLEDPCARETVFICVLFGFLLPLFTRMALGPAKKFTLNFIPMLLLFVLLVSVCYCAPIPLTYDAWSFVFWSGGFWIFCIFIFTCDGMFTDKLRRKIIDFFKSDR